MGVEEPRSIWRNTGVLASDYTYITVGRRRVKGWPPIASRSISSGPVETALSYPSLTLRVSVPRMKYEPLLKYAGTNEDVYDIANAAIAKFP